jgi:glyoxylase-like metal-dependent hydrolase (beta-lactamase superfamily II)
MITPGLYGVLSSAVNVFILDDPDSGVTVIDSGLPGSAKRILQSVQELGHTPQDVKQILITHADLDHVGGLSGLVKATGAQVYASAESAQYLRGRRNPPHMKLPVSLLAGLITLLIRRPTQVAHPIQNDEVLTFAGGIHAIRAPGHTPDHTCYFWPRERVLFAGDLFRNGQSGLNFSPAAITDDQAAAQRSAQTVLALDPAVICVGHGGVWRLENDPGRIETILTGIKNG